MITLKLLHSSNNDKSVYPKGNSLNIRKTPSVKGELLITVPANTYIGTVLGEWTGRDDKGYKWYSVKLFKTINGSSSGSVREDVIRLESVPNISDMTPDETNKDSEFIAETEKLVKNVVAIDVIIYKRLILIYAQLIRAKAHGVDITKQMRVFELLVQKYKIRQKIIKSYDVIKTETPVYPLYKWISDKFGLGAIQIPLAVIVIAVAIGTLALAYMIKKAFTPVATGQADDLKITGEFQKFFDSLPADKKEIIKADLQQQLKDAYNKGAEESGMGFTDILKWGAVGVIGVFIFNQFQEGKSKREYKQALTNKVA